MNLQTCETLFSTRKTLKDKPKTSRKIVNNLKQNNMAL